MDNKRSKLHELGFQVGILERGEKNSIADVPDVTVGHSTIIAGEGELKPGFGPIRTGVTIVKPHSGNIYRDKVRASSYVFNGYGKTTGLVQVEELGNIESYIGLTNTLNIPKVAESLLRFHLDENPDIGIKTSTINILVGECHDGYLNDIQGRHVQKIHVFEAIENASSDFEEGSVGAGTGMSTLGFKGGIGSSSRVIKDEEIEFVLGTLVLTNFGRKNDLTILGHNFAKYIDEGDKEDDQKEDDGSIIIVVATNAPLNTRQLKRLAKRAPLGLAKTGSYGSHGSGDVIIVFSTENKVEHDNKERTLSMTYVNENTKIFRDLLRAVVETTEEAIINSLLKATTVIGRDDNKKEAISIEKVKEILSK
ncbi:MAG: P1 family peptidase [Candidatus Heimdallarchaeota archaeon]|nr:P1 family peptidase [Candidatus Heimdallarchaeota archaeon]